MRFLSFLGSLKFDLKCVIWLLLVIAAVLAVFFLQDDDVQKTARKKIVNYKYINSNAQPKQKILRFYGTTEADEKVTLVSEISGKIVNINVTEGQSLTKGEVILEIDQKDYLRKVKAAKADVASKSISYQSAVEMKKSGYGAKLSVAKNEAALLQAKADLHKAEIDLAACHIRTPYSGIINKIDVGVNDYVSPTVKLGEFLSREMIKVRFGVPARDFDEVRLSQQICVASEGKDMVCQPGVLFISYVAEKISRIFTAEILLPNKSHILKSGQIVDVNVDVGSYPAHKIPQSSLSVDFEGNIGVKIIDGNNIARHAHVSIIDEDNDGYWVIGLPEQVKIITIGHHDTLDGFKIDAQIDEKSN